MKKILLTISIGFLVFTNILLTGCNGCKEIGPNLTLSKPNPSNVYSDSTWMLSATSIAALTSDTHNVLIEEFSGQTCLNCPGGHVTIDAAKTQYPGRINAVCMYPTDFSQANPVPGISIYDFRDTLAEVIANYVAGATVGGLPSAFIDRVPSGGHMEIDGSTSWPGIINNRLPLVDSVNLAVQSSYNTTTMMATITATIIYTQPTATKQNLSIVVVEDSMTDIQEDPSFPSGFDSTYIFTDVFRGMVSSTVPAGDPILDTMAVKLRGRAYQRTYTYKLKSVTPAIVPAHCRVIAFVNSVNGTDYHVMQSAQAKLTGH